MGLYLDAILVEPAGDAEVERQAYQEAAQSSTRMHEAASNGNEPNPKVS